MLASHPTLKGETMKTPLEKSIVRRFEASGTNYVVVDEDRLNREVLKDSIADSDVQKLLPFYTKRVGGETFIHIQNQSAYTVKTDRHFIDGGETLCARSGPTYFAGFKGLSPTCPGCLAKAKTIIVDHLLATELELN
jgi:hypothetical protein